MAYKYDFEPSSRQQAFVEYIEEATFGAGIPAKVANTPGPGAPNMLWFGSITNWDDQSKIKTESKNYLAPASVVSRTSAVKNAKTGEEVGFNMDYMVQKNNVLTGLCYALGTNKAGVTATTGATTLPITDTLNSIAVGQAFTNTGWNDATRFNQFLGMVCEEFTLTIPDEGAVTAKTKWVGVEKTSGVDWVDTGATPKGTHAADPCTAVLNSQAVTDFKIRTSTYGGVNATEWAQVPLCRDAVGSIEMKVVNKIGLPKDMSSTWSTKVKAAVLLGRKITLAFDLTYADITGGAIADAITLENIRSFKPFDIQYKFDGYLYEYSRARFPELPYKAGGEDLVGDKLTTLPIGDVCSGTAALVISKIA